MSIGTYLVQRITSDVAGNVVRAKIFDEPNDACGVPYGDVVGLPGYGVVEHQVVGSGSRAGQSLGLPEARHSHQDVAVVTCYEGRVYAQVFGYSRPGPAPRKCSPRPVQTFEREVTEVGLEHKCERITQEQSSLRLNNSCIIL